MSVDYARPTSDRTAPVSRASRPPERPRNLTAPESHGGGVTTLLTLLRVALQILSAPFLAYLSIRKSMTVASVVTLLTLVMTLNVIWGFPWSGMMGGCLALLVGGWAINRFMFPRLGMSVSLPRSAIAGQPFSINVRLTNQRYFPALDMRLGWHREGVKDIYQSSEDDQWEASPPVSVRQLSSGEQMQWHGAMRFEKRGIHPLPPFQVSSSFPFHLFHVRRSLDTETEIAITPPPLGADEDPTSRVMLANIGDWAKQLVAGAPVEYIGNREYEVGMPVRRWDFASWARLGRPIVREYQAPSIQAVTLVVDTSQSDLSRGGNSPTKAEREIQEWEFEHLMSVAVTAIQEITGRRVQLKLRLPGEDDVQTDDTAARHLEGCEPMLVRLAAAKPMDPVDAEEKLIEIIEDCRSQPVLILSLFDLDRVERNRLSKQLPSNVTYLPTGVTDRRGGQDVV